MMKQETERLIKEQYELDQYEIQRNQLEECNTQRNDGYSITSFPYFT